MMRAKADTKATTTTLYLLACLFLAGSVAGILWPKPKPKDTRRDLQKQKITILQANADARTAQAAVLQRTWIGSDVEIANGVYNLATGLARKRGVSFVRLQPGRAALGGPLEQLPYLLVVEGPFPAVAALEKDLEVPANRLAVSAFQLAASDTSTNKVSASIGVVAERVGTDVGTGGTKNGQGS